MLDNYYKQYNIKYNKLISPEYNDNWNKETYSMYLAKNSIIPPKEWEHESNL